MAYRPAYRLDDLWSGEMIGLVIDGTRVLLVNDGGTIHAYEDRCAHLGVPLSEGRFQKTTLTCGAHHWQYDVRTGHGINPACVSLRSFPLIVEDGRICVEIEAVCEVGGTGGEG